MRKNKIWFEYKQTEKSFEKTSERPSMTVPDETLTVKEILQRHIRGQRIADELMRRGEYDSGASYDSDDIEKLRDEDIFDREQKIDSIKQNIEQNKQNQKSFFSKKKEEQKKATAAESTQAAGAAEDDVFTSDKNQKTQPKSVKKTTNQDDRREDAEGG